MNNIEIYSVRNEHMNDVIELLQSISEYRPMYIDHDIIWSEYSSQKNVFGVVAFIGSRLVGFGSILIEIKLRGGRVGHIEEIVCHPGLRNQGVGKAIVEALNKIARERDCYKLVLACEESVRPFYEGLLFQSNGVSMKRLI